MHRISRRFSYELGFRASVECRVQCLGCRINALGLWRWLHGSGLGINVWGSMFGDQCLGINVWGSMFRDQRLGINV
jgi:hypothetical protein